MDNPELLAVTQTWDNGKPVRATLAADIPLAADHFPYFAGAVRAQEGSLSQIEQTPRPTLTTSRSASWATSPPASAARTTS